MIEHDLIWAMLPDGLQPYFEIEQFERDEKVFRIILVEKNILPELSPEQRGKPVINTLLKSFTVDFFPIKGRKGELILKRRMWQVEGSTKLIKRDLDICAEGTHLEKEFAIFLKAYHREGTGGDQPGGTLELPEEQYA